MSSSINTYGHASGILRAKTPEEYYADHFARSQMQRLSVPQVYHDQPQLPQTTDDRLLLLTEEGD